MEKEEIIIKNIEKLTKRMRDLERDIDRIERGENTFCFSWKRNDDGGVTMENKKKEKITLSRKESLDVFLKLAEMFIEGNSETSDYEMEYAREIGYEHKEIQESEEIALNIIKNHLK